MKFSGLVDNSYPSNLLMCENYIITCIFVIEEKPLAQNCTLEAKIIFRTHFILYLEI